MTGSAKLAMPLEEAQAIARDFKWRIATACMQVDVAGSVRRGKQLVGDIEILCVPRRPGFLEVDPFEDAIAGIERIKGGPKYTQLRWRGATIDLRRVPDAKAWGVAMVIWTGPSEFNKLLVTTRLSGGLLPGGHRVSVSDGRIYRGTQEVPAYTEREVLEYICGGWVDPEHRARFAGDHAMRQRERRR